MAAPIFGAAGLVLGFVLSHTVGGYPPLDVILAAVIAGPAAYLVFASQSRQRPPSVVQASIADGVVTGLVAGIPLAVAISLVAHGAGASVSSHIVGDTVTAAALTAVAAGAGGGICGYLVLLAGGRGRLERTPPRSTLTRKSSRGRKNRKR